jgi:hypothetical protein
LGNGLASWRDPEVRSLKQRVRQLQAQLGQQAAGSLDVVTLKQLRQQLLNTHKRASRNPHKHSQTLLLAKHWRHALHGQSEQQ